MSLASPPGTIIETEKNLVEITGERVLKRFKQTSNGARRFRRELAALQRLTGLDGVPALLAFSRDERVMVVTRLPGLPLSVCPDPPDSVFKHLRQVVQQMLQRGIARHSLPARDIIVRPDGGAGLVDFERTTRCGWRLSPVWLIARTITTFHLLRQIERGAPHLLTDAEQQRLRVLWPIRNAFRRCTKPAPATPDAQDPSRSTALPSTPADAHAGPR